MMPPGKFPQFVAQPSSTRVGIRGKEQREEYQNTILDFFTSPLESTRKVVHDTGTAIGANKDLPQADVMDLVNTALIGLRPAREVGRHILGRTVTNVFEPFDYMNPVAKVRQALHIARQENPSQHPVKTLIDAVVSDTPVYRNWQGFNDAGDVMPRFQMDMPRLDARMVPYRMMFGLQPPKAGTAYYMPIEEGSRRISFAPRLPNREDNPFWRETRIKEKSWTGYDQKHSVMGAYEFNPETREYYDLWDWAINKGEWRYPKRDFLSAVLGKDGGEKLNIGERLHYLKLALSQTSTLGARKLMSMAVDPVEISGIGPKSPITRSFW